MFGFERHNDLYGYGGLCGLSSRMVVGKVYQLSSKDITGIRADNVSTRFDKHKDGSSTLALTLDLNPTREKARYLKLLFEYS